MKPNRFLTSRAARAARTSGGFLSVGTAGARRALAKTGGRTPLTAPKVADNETVGGLKEALLKGVAKSVMELGREGGFFDNKRVRIPTPAPLRPVEKTLRFMRQGRDWSMISARHESCGGVWR